ncbi:hypothetical protein [Corynebacterium aquilae]|uniref:hypothetical protein n=1 Tax=Corynebacterium aquilae TaxID=203263 RepID=UPI0012EE6216|nr:hypothetical protein [Corynebacterium aquilae]
MDIKPQDFRAQAHGPNPQELKEQVLALLEKNTTSLEEETVVLNQAHELLKQAL